MMVLRFSVAVEFEKRGGMGIGEGKDGKGKARGFVCKGKDGKRGKGQMGRMESQDNDLITRLQLFLLLFFLPFLFHTFSFFLESVLVSHFFQRQSVSSFM